MDREGLVEEARALVTAVHGLHTQLAKSDASLPWNVFEKVERLRASAERMTVALKSEPTGIVRLKDSELAALLAKAHADGQASAGEP